MKEGVLRKKSYLFEISVVKIAKIIRDEKKDYIISNQLLRSGTGIGALIREANYAESKADFVHKLSIALKEANETEYWLNILFDTEYINKIQYFLLYKCLNLRLFFLHEDCLYNDIYPA